jgi:superfamily II DNA or RNA helicase
MRKVLFKHQEQALSLLRRSVASGKRRPMLAAPCGFGKTVLAIAAVERARMKGNTVLFTVLNLAGRSDGGAV